MPESSDKLQKDKPQKDAEAAASAGSPGDQAPPAAEQERAQVQIDDSRAVTAYANLFRMAGTPEELILDFGLNPQPLGASPGSILINQRVILSYYTAKRMLHALQLTIQRHEAAFGVLETDVQKRVRPGAVGTPAKPPAGR